MKPFEEAFNSLFDGFNELLKSAYENEGKKIIKSVRGKRPEPKNYDFYNKSDWVAGIWKNELLVLDFDSEMEYVLAEKLVKAMQLKCNRIKTLRGGHIYFRNLPKGHKFRIEKLVGKGNVCCIGLECEYKVSIEGKNPPYEPLKIGDYENRKFEFTGLDENGNDTIYSFEELDELPLIFYHYKERESVFNKGDGDGRNSILSEFVMGLQKKGLNREQISDICLIINKVVFAEPLGQREYETILRDESFSKILNTNNFSNMNTADSDRTDFCQKGYGFMHQVAAKFLIARYNIKKINDAVYVYSNGIYTIKDLDQIIVDGISNLTEKDTREIKSYMTKTKEGIQNFEITKEEGYEYIAFKNGLWSNKTMSLHKFTPDKIALFKIDVDLVENPKPDKYVDKFLNDISCNDIEIRALLEEAGGFCLNPRTENGKAFFLYGGGENGKTTFLDTLQAVFGSENCSSLAYNELSEKFLLAELQGKILNLSGEISKDYVTETDIFKKLVTGDSIVVRRIYGAPFKLSNTAKFFFAGNDLPKTNDTSHGFNRRLIIIPFLANFSNKGKNKIERIDRYIDFLTTKEAKEYWIWLFINAYKRLQENGFTISKKTEELKNDYMLSNNKVLQYIDENGHNSIENELVSHAYNEFKFWLQQNGYKIMSKMSFSAELKNLGYDVVINKVNGKSLRYYEKTTEE